MTWDDATRFLVDHIVQPDVSSLMLFKFAQLCTIIHLMDFTPVTDAFPQFERQIAAAYLRIEQAAEFDRWSRSCSGHCSHIKTGRFSGQQEPEGADDDSIRMISPRPRSVSSLFV
jgi:hypothetical protein